MNKKFVVIFFILFTTTNVHAGPNNTNEFVDKGIRSNKAAVEMLASTIKMVPKWKYSGKLNSKQAYATTKYLREEIANIKYGRSVAAPSLYLPYNIGDIGLIGTVEILQVIDKNNAIVQYKHNPVITQPVLFWLEVDTDGMTNGGYTTITTVVKLIETTTYNTIIGTNTVYKLQLISSEQLNKIKIHYKMKNGKTKEYNIITIGSILRNIQKIKFPENTKE